MPSKKKKTPIISDYIRQQRFLQIRAYLSPTVLDLGCARGNLLDTNFEIKTYVGVDSRPDFLESAKTNHPNQTFHLINLEYETLSTYIAGRFQTIVMTAILEHLHNASYIMRQLPALLEKNGVIVATTPTPLGHKVHAVGARLGLFYREAAAEHHTIFSKKKLYDLVESHRLQVVHYQTFEFGCNQLIVARGI